MSILALHGFTGRGSDFAPFAKLCGGEWHSPDLPGHGPNPLLDCTPKATVDYIHQLSAVFEATTLLGYSLGARAALHHAITYPEAWDALILISPNPGIEDDTRRMARAHVDEKLAQRIEHEGAAAFIEFWQSTPMIRSQQYIRPDWRETMQAARQEQTAEGLAASLRQFGQGHSRNLWPELSKITLPVLLLTGEQDLKYRAIAERMAAAMPVAQHLVIANVGHMPHLEAPEATAEAIRMHRPACGL